MPPFLPLPPPNPQVLAANDRYDAACAAIARGGAELYPSRAVQTLNVTTKNKEIGAVPPATRSSEAQADSWDIYDSIRASSEAAAGGSGEGGATGHGGAGAAARGVGGGGSLERVVDAMVSVSLATPGCLIDADTAVNILPPQPAGSGAGARGKVKDGGVASSSAVGVGSSAALGGAGVGGGLAGKGGGLGVSNAAAGVSGGKGWGRESRSSSMSEDAMSQSQDGGGRSRSGSVVLGQAPGAGGAGAGGAGGMGGGADGDDGAGPLDVVVQQQANRIFRSRALLDGLALVERAVQQNLYHVSHRKYRSGPAQDLLDTLLEAGLRGGHAGAAAVLKAHSSTGEGDRKDGAAAAGKHGASGASAGDKALIEGSAEEADADAEAAAAGAAGDSSAGAGDAGEEKKDEGADAPAEGSGAGDAPASHNGGAGSGSAGASSADAGPGSHAASASSAGPSLMRLWTYKCPEVAGLNVTGMVWNRANRDLLAVAYGPYDFAQAGAGRGAIALWNLSSPEFPQAILSTPDGTGVTAIDFSSAHPSLLAAGMYNGCVCVYDVAKVLTGKTGPAPALTSDKLQTGSHTEPVWQVKWVTPPDAAPDTEVIVSVSTDGRVTEWSIKKGLTPTPLMVLKRARAAPDPSKGGSAAQGGAAAGETAASATLGGGKSGAASAANGGGDSLGATGSDGLLSRTASGLSFDFPPTDTSQYLVGTEDGLLARCSISYAEQYLDVTQAHSGPVNRVRLSPFLPHACLTASSDWTVRMWSVPVAGGGGSSSSSSSSSSSIGGLRPITYSTDDVHNAVTDVAWSPSVSTRFASVTRDGHIQVWEASQLQPVLSNAVPIDEEEWRAIQAKEVSRRASARGNGNVVCAGIRPLNGARLCMCPALCSSLPVLYPLSPLPPFRRPRSARPSSRGV